MNSFSKTAPYIVIVYCVLQLVSFVLVPECVPDLTHLCRLAVRATVGSDALSKPSFVQQLPVPALLHDYLQFNDISSMYTFKASSNQESDN